MQRRDFLKLSASAGAVSCLTACGGKSSQTATDTDIPITALAPENIDYATCTCNCFFNCVLKVHSRDDVITRVESEGQAEGDDIDLRQAKACYRGRSAKQRVAHPDRLKYPMKRVEGTKRGEGQFERISWDEAFQLIADNLTRVREQYGNDAVLPLHGTGTLEDGTQAGTQWPFRLLNVTGGCTRYHGSYSQSQIDNAAYLTYGNNEASTSDNLTHSDMLLAFCWNPNEMNLTGAGNGYEWVRQFEHLNDAFFVDPRYTDTMLGKESKWVPIRPGTDAALVEGIAYMLISRDQVDEEFLAKYCVGYDETTLPASAGGQGSYKAYILGTEDGVPKTPERAAGITGIPAEQIIEIADKLAAAERPFICQGFGIQRSANGEQHSRAIMMLPLLLGKFGVLGTNSGFMPTAHVGSNMILEPVPVVFFSALGTLDIEGYNPVRTSFQASNWLKACELDDGSFTVQDFDLQTLNEYGRPETDPEKIIYNLPNGIKFIWAYASNTLVNQHMNTTHTKRVLEDESKVQFIVMHDVRHTASTLYADLILPGTMDFEQDEMVFSANINTRTAVAASTSIKPSFEAKNCYEVCLGVAQELGLEQEFSEGRTQEEWARYMWEFAQTKDERLPDYDEMREIKVLSLPESTTLVAYDKYVEDPVANPLWTPSGKIEIYSETLAFWHTFKNVLPHETVTAIPTYCQVKEGYELHEGLSDEEREEELAVREQFPLQFINVHGKPRVHSNFELPWTREAVEDPLWMNPVDAEARGLVSGEKVQIESLRGKVHKILRVTPRITPGVVCMCEGANHKVDSNGIDVGGCANTLLSGGHSPIAKNMMSNTNRVEVTAV